MHALVHGPVLPARAAARRSRAPARCGVSAAAPASRAAAVGPRAAAGGATSRLRRVCRLAPLRAAPTEGQGTVDENVLEYCDIDKNRKRTLGEKEQDFLMALQSFYDTGKPVMSNEEFDNLKQELIWEGSKVAVLSSTEQRFLEASLAFAAGKPIMSDAEYDALKLELKTSGSDVALAGPRCSLRSQRVYSDSTVDYVRMTLLNVPGALVGLLACFVVDDLSGFGITQLVELPEPFGFIAVWFVVLPVIYLISAKFTSLLLKDSVVLQAPCPNCGSSNIAFFGDILTVEGSKDQLDVTCDSCKQLINFQRRTRQVVLIKS